MMQDLKNTKVAIIFYGMIRNYCLPSKSIKKHIIKPNNGDVYYFGPSYTDRPSNSHYGKFDKDGFLMENPKSAKDSVFPAEIGDFIETYSDCIKNYKIHDLKFSFFEEEADSVSRRDEWLFQLNPARVLSMFYNMSGAIEEFLKFSNENSLSYDACVLMRPDLVFYNRVLPQAEDGKIYIPKAQGISERGETYDGNAPVYFYKNAYTGEYIPGGRKITFNDQFLIMTQKEISTFKGMYDEVKDMMKRKVPLSPETLFYLMTKNRFLDVIINADWVYEIYRNDTKLISNIIDSPELRDIDRYHPSLKEKTKSRFEGKGYRSL